MTTRHLIDGLMRHTRAHSHQHLAIQLAVEGSVISRLYNGPNAGVHIGTLDRIQQRSGVSFEALFAWYRQPASDPLPRSISPSEQRKRDYAEFDAVLLANIDAGRNTRRAFVAEESGLRSLAASRGWRRTLEYHLQVLRDRGVIRFDGKGWVRITAV